MQLIFRCVRRIRTMITTNPEAVVFGMLLVLAVACVWLWYPPMGMVG
ncbi:hypothetical protein [Actinophytocola sp.]